MKYIALLLVLPLSGCAIIGTAHAIKALSGHSGSVLSSGSGHAKTETRTVGTYSRVMVSAAIQATFKEGPLSPLTVTADDNLLAKVNTRVEGDTLIVSLDGITSTKTTITISGSAPKIETAHATGATGIELTLNSKHSLELEASGASEITLSGPVGDTKVEASGASHVTLPEGTMQHLIAHVTGASQLTAPVHTDEASITASGASSVEGVVAKSSDVDSSGASSVNIEKG